MHKENRNNKDLQDVNTILGKSFKILQNYEGSNEVSIEYLEAVAGVRFCLHQMAELFNSACRENQPILSDTMYELFDQVENLCTDQTINQGFDSQMIGPGMYFIRLFVRIFGFSSLLRVSGFYKWIIPERFSTKVSLYL